MHFGEKGVGTVEQDSALRRHQETEVRQHAYACQPEHQPEHAHRADEQQRQIHHAIGHVRLPAVVPAENGLVAHAFRRNGPTPKGLGTKISDRDQRRTERFTPVVADLPGPSLEHSLLCQPHSQGQVLQTVAGRLPQRQVAVAVDQHCEAEPSQCHSVVAGRQRNRKDAVLVGRIAPSPPEKDERSGESAQGPGETGSVTQPGSHGQQPQGARGRLIGKQVFGSERSRIGARASYPQREMESAAVLLVVDTQLVDSGVQSDAPCRRDAPGRTEARRQSTRRRNRPPPRAT